MCVLRSWEKIKKPSLILNTEPFARCFFLPLLGCLTPMVGSAPVLHQPSSCRRAELSAAHRGDCQMQPGCNGGRSRMEDSQPAGVYSVDISHHPRGCNLTPTTLRLESQLYGLVLERVPEMHSTRFAAIPDITKILFRINCFAFAVFIPVEHQPRAHVLKS